MTNKEQTITYRERSAFYEVEYLTTVDQPFLASLVSHRVHSLLEIPAGVGRNLDWLAKTGCFTVVADIEATMVARLAERVNMLSARDRISPIKADMRCFNLGMKFDLIFVPREAFQLLICDDEAFSALVSLRRHLAHNGILVIDIALFEPHKHDKDKILPDYYDPFLPDGQLVTEWTRALLTGGTLTRWRMQHHHERTVSIEFLYLLRREDHTESALRSLVELRRYSYNGFLDLCSKANLRPSLVYRNYRQECYELDSCRAIFLFRPSSTNGSLI
jgi:cyclopropane fatty-acyl-phospholipid synthase-like methyltransferase